jgi:tight adherence protein C
MGFEGILLVVIFAWMALLFAAVSYVSFQSEHQSLHRYLEEEIHPLVEQSRRTGDWLKQLHAWFDRLAPTGEKIQLLSEPEELEDVLVKAGHPYGLTVDRLQGAKVVGAIMGGGFGFLYFLLGLPMGPLMLIGGLFGGYMLPIWLVRRLAKKRQEQIRREIPDFLDIMSITLQAGMGLDAALAHSVQTFSGPLSEEFARMSREIRFGVQRESAYRALMQRTTSPELEALLQSLIQAHNLGTPVSDIFMQQADEIRRMRAEKAKEVAGKASPKISLVSGLVIAPSIMLLLFGAFALKFFFGEDSIFSNISF